MDKADLLLASMKGASVSLVEALREARALLTGFERDEATGVVLRSIDEAIHHLDATELPTNGPTGSNVFPTKPTNDSSNAAEIRTASPNGAKSASEVRQRFLDEASATLLSADLSYEARLEVAANLAVPDFADWACVDVVSGDGLLERLATAHIDPEKLAYVLALSERYPPDPKAPRGAYEVVRTGQSEMAEIPDELIVAVAVDEEHLRIIRELGLRSYICAPLIARNGTIGAISFVRTNSRTPYVEADLEVANEIARRAAMALENARLYRDVELQRSKAERAVATRDEFIATASHDLRGPLSNIVMASAVIERIHPTDARVTKPLATIRRATDRMSALIHDLLDIARIEGNAFEVEPSPILVDSVLKEAFESHQPAAREKGVQLDLHSFPSRTLMADRSRLLQVLSNLLGNAIKFTPSGGLVSISASEIGSDLKISVSDTGPGIPEEQLALVFDRFWQGKGSSRSGAGLGLAICRGIVEQHGGKLWVESKLGEGSTFAFTMPCTSPSSLAAQ